MSSVHEYFDKCLAECPEGAEDVLLGELAKRVLRKYRPLDRLEVRDRDGLVGYLLPAFLEIEDLPADVRANALRETDPNEKGLSLEECEVLLNRLEAQGYPEPKRPSNAGTPGTSALVI